MTPRTRDGYLLLRKQKKSDVSHSDNKETHVRESDLFTTKAM